MKNLASPKVIKEILEESGFRFSKSLGQNFLIDENVLDKMIAGSGIEKNTNVIEIGPGFGTLTQRLCQNAKKVVAIEIDKTAVPILQNNLEEFDNLKIINDDVLKCDLNKIIKEELNISEKIEEVKSDEKSIKDKLIEFRKKRSVERKIPAYYIFNNEELDKILEHMPKKFEELKNLKILTDVKVNSHGKDIVNIINSIIFR